MGGPVVGLGILHPQSQATLLCAQAIAEASLPALTSLNLNQNQVGDAAPPSGLELRAASLIPPAARTRWATQVCARIAPPT